MDENLKKGIELIRQVDNSAAIPFLEKALENNPTNPEILGHLGLAFFNLGNYEKALEKWKNALDLDPNHHPTIWNLGNLYEIEQRYDEAYKAYKKAAVVATKSSNPVKAKRYDEWAARLKKE
jgi:tetratricopeptide (TPR) repeat protein